MCTMAHMYFRHFLWRYKWTLRHLSRIWKCIHKLSRSSKKGHWWCITFACSGDRRTWYAYLPQSLLAMCICMSSWILYYIQVACNLHLQLDDIIVTQWMVWTYNLLRCWGDNIRCPQRKQCTQCSKMYYKF